MGMPWHVVLNPRQCFQNPFYIRNKGVVPDLAVGIPHIESSYDPPNEDVHDTATTAEEDDYCPLSIIDAFTKTM
eukprot:7781094-Heterocapsa_arctica.AAC.1